MPLNTISLQGRHIDAWCQTSPNNASISTHRAPRCCMSQVADITNRHSTSIDIHPLIVTIITLVAIIRSIHPVT